MQLKNLLFAAAAASVAYAQDNETTEDMGENGAMNLTSLIAATPELSTLGEIVMGNPEILAAFGNLTNATIFAPNNEAFEEALELLGVASIDEADEATVMAILQYHVVGTGAITSEALTATPQFLPTTLNDTEFTSLSNGQRIEVGLEDEEPYVAGGWNRNASIVAADNEFDGGVVHIIDAVLLPPGNVSASLNAIGFDNLLGAVEAANLTEPLTEAGNITIFAPNNAAFDAIANLAADIEPEMLADILQYHVVEGLYYSTGLANDSTLTSMQGADLNINIYEDGSVFVNQAEVVFVDFKLANGVLHIINSVLNPEAEDDANAPMVNATEPAVAFEGAEAGEWPEAAELEDALYETPEPEEDDSPIDEPSATPDEPTDTTDDGSVEDATEDAAISTRASLTLGAVMAAAVFALNL